MPRSGARGCRTRGRVLLARRGCGARGKCCAWGVWLWLSKPRNPLVNIKIGGKWIHIPPQNGAIGYAPWPFSQTCRAKHGSHGQLQPSVFLFPRQAYDTSTSSCELCPAGWADPKHRTCVIAGSQGWIFPLIGSAHRSPCFLDKSNLNTPPS